MDATPLMTSSPEIAIHAFSALFAMVLGTLVLFLDKGTPLHKALGRVWVGVMAVVALSSFLITEARMFGPYSIIHALSVLTLFSLVGGVLAARRKNILAHRATMISLYCFALLLTGAFTLLHGRRMKAVIFADGGTTAALVAALAAALIGIALLTRRRSARA